MMLQFYSMKSKQLTNTLCVLIICLFFPFAITSQNSKFKEKFTEGNFLLLEKNYQMALRNFLEAYAIDSSNCNLDYKIGICYLNLSSEKEKALSFLEKSINNTTRHYSEFEPSETKAPQIAYYYLGQAYRINNKIKESIATFDKYKDLAKPSETDLKQIDKDIHSSEIANVMIHSPINVIIENLGDSINTEYPEYSPVLPADESVMYFTSRRPGSTGGERAIDDQFYEDIYMSMHKKDGTWSRSINIGLPINTNANESCVSISADGQQLFLFKDINGGDIYVSNLDGEKWSTPQPLGSDINTKYLESYACISADGNTIYFVSDRPGGFGGKDIYRSVKLPNGQWSLALNLGPEINTPYDEDCPFIHPDGVTLYFSSKGHNSMGGYDIFRSTKSNSDGFWSTPSNLGYPINTVDDDLFYTTTANGKNAYYSSSKSGGKGDKDIYRIELESVLSEPVALVKGNITLDGSNDFSTLDVTVKAYEVETGEKVQEAKPNSKTGKYVLTLSPGVNGKMYNIVYEANGYQTITEAVKVQPGSEYQEVEHEEALKPINFQSKQPGTISVEGNVVDSLGNKIGGTKIIVKDNNTGSLVGNFTTNNEDGSYYFILKSGKNYNLLYEADGYLYRSENVNFDKGEDFHTIKKNVILEKIKTGTTITLNNLFFETSSSTINKQSRLELEKLFNLMCENPKLIIEIAGYTDNRGATDANIKLSTRRANTVVEYLIKRGISSKRLVAKGLGAANPKVPNTMADGKPNLEGMKLNRRVEMKILEYK